MDLLTFSLKENKVLKIIIIDYLIFNLGSFYRLTYFVCFNDEQDDAYCTYQFNRKIKVFIKNKKKIKVYTN